MEAAILNINARRKMTPAELKKKLAEIGLNTKEGAIRWQQNLARVFVESDWTQDELGAVVDLHRTRVGQILHFGHWLNETRGLNTDFVNEKIFRRCSRQIMRDQPKADHGRWLALVDQLIEKELAKPKPQKLPKIKSSDRDKATLESLVKPGRWNEAKKLIDAMAQERAQQMTKSLERFYDIETAKAKAATEEYRLLARKLNQIMTEAEFKLIRGCLHPDRQSDQERRNRAFEIFNRIGQSIKKWD